MKFSEACIQRPVFTAMLNLALIVFGFLGLQRLPVRELPDIDPAVVTVLTVYPGASAEVVETEITERVEEAVSSASGIKLLTSESREQVSSVKVEFIQGTDVDVAAQDLRDRVSRIRGKLPDDIDEPVFSKQDSAAQPIMWVALFSERYSTEELTKIADEQIKDRLQTVPGVSQVIIGGEKKLAFRLWIDPARMASRQVTISDVEAALTAQNIELPSGRVEGSDRELTIQTRGQLSTPEEFEGMIIRQAGAEVVYFRDIGRVTRGVEDERSIARFKSQPSVGLGIVRQSKANTLDVAAEVKAVMARLAPTLPPGIQMQYPYDESIFISKSVSEVWGSLGLSFGLVVLVIFVFLRNLRSTVIPVLAVPVSVIATFGVMHLLGYSINIFTLLALVLAIGIVVDDAVVVLENIYRHIEEGKPPLRAALESMGEIAFPVIATTIALIAVFLPITFIGGLTGKLLTEFSVALCVSVAVSAFVALTLTPMMSGRVLKPVHSERHGRLFNLFERGFDRMARRYDRTLGWCMRHRGVIIFLALLSLAGTGYFMKNLEREFLPEEDKGQMLSLTITPVGSTPDYTNRMMRQVEAIAAANPAVAGYFTAIALPFQGPGDPAMGFMFIRLVDRALRPHIRDIVGGPNGLAVNLITQVEGSLSFPIMPKAVNLGFSQPFEVVVMHPDLKKLNDITQGVAGRLMKEGFLSGVRSTYEINKPELRVRVDRERAGALGVSIREISRTLQILFGGVDVSEVKVGGKQYEVIAQLDRADRGSPADLERLYVRGAGGKLVPLSNLVSYDTGAGPNVIRRFNRQRCAVIEGTPSSVPLGTAVDRTEAILAEMLPPDAAHDWQGEARNLQDTSSEIWWVIALAMVVVYMTLAAQFESLIHPLTIMLSLPLAFFGAFGLLYA
ncbi:MAG: efflux RND transporter permease subunit, partial [Kiritimatiellia bacterium]